MVDSKQIKQEEGEAECTGLNDSATQAFTPNEPQSELKIPCPEADCDLVFPSVTALRAHKRDGHGHPLPSDKTQAHTECDEIAALPKQFQESTAQAHLSGYNCPTCGESFAQESDLYVHEKTHTEGEEVAGNR